MLAPKGSRLTQTSTQHRTANALEHQGKTNTMKSRILRNLRGDRHLREVPREDMLDVRGPLDTNLNKDHAMMKPRWIKRDLSGPRPGSRNRKGTLIQHVRRSPRPLGSNLKASWGHLSAILRHPGAILGPSWNSKWPQDGQQHPQIAEERGSAEYLVIYEVIGTSGMCRDRHFGCWEASAHQFWPQIGGAWSELINSAPW